MARLAFCGLGQMGAPTAGRLLQAGHEVVVWNRTPERAAPLVERGAKQAESPAEAAAGVEAAITMLATPEAVEAVLLGPRGLAEGLQEGSALIEMSTIGPAAVRDIAARLPAGVSMLDAPVLGTVPQAEAGTLKVFAGGAETLVRRWLHVLEALGSVRRMGELGAGAATKLVVNSALLAVMSALGEALALAEGLGLDHGAILDVLEDSPIGVAAKSKRRHVETGEYPPNFKLELAAKDAGLVARAAEEAGVELRVAAAARSWFEGAERAGLGSLDYSAVLAHIRGRPATRGPARRPA